MIGHLGRFPLRTALYCNLTETELDDRGYLDSKHRSGLSKIDRPMLLGPDVALQYIGYCTVPAVKALSARYILQRPAHGRSAVG